MRDRKVSRFSVEDEDSLSGKCHNLKYDTSNPQGDTMAFTKDSDLFDGKGYKAAPGKDRKDFIVPQENIACSMDLCNWYLHKQFKQGWPKIDKEQVQKTQQPGFKGGVKEYATPVDGLRNLGLTFLHEVRIQTAYKKPKTNSASSHILLLEADWMMQIIFQREFLTATDGIARFFLRIPTMLVSKKFWIDFNKNILTT
jgi:hypothetical protein